MGNMDHSTRLEEMWRTGELKEKAKGARSWADIARAVGMSPGALDKQKKRAKAAGREVPALEELIDAPLPVIPEGHTVRGVSTLVDADGKPKGQWIKTVAADKTREAWLEAIKRIGNDLPRIRPIPAPKVKEKDLLCVYPLGDPHIGQLSWDKDAGENFDLGIAEKRIVSAVKHLVDGAPSAAEALLILIGDNTHSDGQSNTTTKGTRVDVDGRTAKMMGTAIRTTRRAIEMLLQKHRKVRVIVERGNHDELLSLMLALALDATYENEPRVSIDTSPEMFHWFRFGRNLIGTHHGHNVKPMDLLGVMAVDRQADWGETSFRRFYCGHYHHIMTKEVPGLIVDYLPTLASSDAWHRSMGYRSGRAMYLDVFDRALGHVDRHIIGVQGLR